MSEATQISNAMMGGILTDTMMNRGIYIGRLEDLKTVGYHFIAAKNITSDFPFPYSNMDGIIEVLYRGGGLLHLFTPVDAKCICQRFYSMTTDKWGSWYKTVLTPCNQ